MMRRSDSGSGELAIDIREIDIGNSTGGMVGDASHDRHKLDDLAGSHAESVTGIPETITAWLRRVTRAAEGTEETGEFDVEAIEQLKALGYVN